MNKKADEDDILAISASSGLDNLVLVSLFPLDKKDPSKYCPLKVVLEKGLSNIPDRKRQVYKSKKSCEIP